MPFPCLVYRGNQRIWTKEKVLEGKMGSSYNKVKKARKDLMFYGDITEKEQHEVIALAMQAEQERSIFLELKILHILFRHPVKV